MQGHRMNAGTYAACMAVIFMQGRMLSAGPHAQLSLSWIKDLGNLQQPSSTIKKNVVLQTVCGMPQGFRKLPLGEDVDSGFFDMMDRQNLVQVGE